MDSDRTEWEEKRSPRGHLMFRLHRKDCLIEWRRGRETVVLNLATELGIRRTDEEQDADPRP